MWQMVRPGTLRVTLRWLRLFPLTSLLLCSLGRMWLSAAQADASMDDCLRKGSFWCSRAAKCVDSRKRCNGVSWDCPYNEDEIECSKTPPKPSPPTTAGLFVPGRGCYLCGGAAQCIVSSMYCDGMVDCPGGDDEINCRTMDGNPPDRPRPDWVWPVMSTVAGLVGGALLCTATALLVQRCRRMRRQRRRRRELECGAAAAASSGNASTARDVAVVVNPPPYDDALGRPFATHNTVYYSTADAPPKYVDIVPPTQSTAPAQEADAVYVDPNLMATGSAARPVDCTASSTIATVETSAPT